MWLRSWAKSQVLHLGLDLDFLQNDFLANNKLILAIYFRFEFEFAMIFSHKILFFASTIFYLSRT